MAVLLSSSVKDGISRRIIRISSNVAHVSVSVWFTWWIDGWIKASIAVTTTCLESFFLFVTSVGGVKGFAEERWITSVEGSGGDGSIVSGVQADGNTVSLASSPSSVRNLVGSNKDSRVAGTWGLIWRNWWDVSDINSGSYQVTVVENITALSVDVSVQIESVVRVVKSKGAAHRSWGTVENGDKVRSNNSSNRSAVSVTDNFGSDIDSSISGVESDVALELFSWNTVVGWVDTFVGVTAASGERVVNGGAVVTKSHGGASTAWITGVEGSIMGVVVDGSSKRDRYTFSVAHAVVWLTDVLSIEVNSFVADNSWIFTSWDSGHVDTSWSKTVVRVRAAASGNLWISSWDLSTVSVISSESKSEVTAHSNWSTVVDSGVLSVHKRVQ